MKLRTFLSQLKDDRDALQRLAEEVGTKPIYLRRIGGRHDPLPSPKLARRIAYASGGQVDLASEYPHLWGEGS